MSLHQLKKYLDSVAPGKVDDTDTVEELLSACWDELSISPESTGGMTAEKLHGRVKSVQWNPPMLTFRIVRHGSTVLGSKRAPRQAWQVNIETGSASFVEVGYKQVHPNQARVDVGPIAEEIIRMILAGGHDERLKWRSKDEVELRTGIVFPSDSAPKQTIEGWRRRLREEVRDRLPPEWSQVQGTPNRFRRSPSSLNI